jgi:phytoene synthase
MSGQGAGDASSEAVVREAARAGDIDRYLAALLAPRRARRDLLALTAFFGEIARIPELVHEPMMGEIRLQWWRDALDASAAGAATGSPVADAVGRTVARHSLSLDLLHSVIDGQASALDPEPHLPDLTEYLLATEGAAFRLTALVLGVPERPPVPDLLAAAAQAFGRARLAGSAVRAGGVPGAALARDARAALGDVRRLLPAAPRAILPAILPVALVEPYLAALQGAGPDITRARLFPLTRVWRLWWASARGRI